jgi:Rrf2 family protein
MSKEPLKMHMIGDISQAQEIPKSFLAKILQRLARAEIVSSTRGVNGGFTLIRKPSEITLLDIIETIQGALAINSCVMDNKSCSRKSHCSVHPVWVEIKDFLADKLREYNFEKFANAADRSVVMTNCIDNLIQAGSNDEGCSFCLGEKIKSKSGR